MGTEHVLAIDLGTGGPKAALVTPEGRITAHEFEPTPIELLGDGGADDARRNSCPMTETNRTTDEKLTAHAGTHHTQEQGKIFIHGIEGARFIFLSKAKRCRIYLPDGPKINPAPFRHLFTQLPPGGFAGRPPHPYAPAGKPSANHRPPES